MYSVMLSRRLATQHIPGSFLLARGTYVTVLIGLSLEITGKNSLSIYNKDTPLRTNVKRRGTVHPFLMLLLYGASGDVEVLT